MRIPKRVRCYDSGGEKGKDDSIGRYTVVFTGRYGPLEVQETRILRISAAPSDEHGMVIRTTLLGTPRPDVEKGRWGGPPIGRRCCLGVRIRFEDLPEDCRKCVLQDYEDLWDLTAEEYPKRKGLFEKSVLHEES